MKPERITAAPTCCGFAAVTRIDVLQRPPAVALVLEL
jgi:hypothetical protein